MKILLDENLPQKPRTEIEGHDVFTTGYMGWAGIENGDLLRLAANAGFDVLISNDRGLEYEQDIDHLPLAVIVLLVKSNTIEALRPLYAELHQALLNLMPKTLAKISSR